MLLSRWLVGTRSGLPYRLRGLYTTRLSHSGEVIRRSCWLGSFADRDSAQAAKVFVLAVALAAEVSIDLYVWTGREWLVLD